jgi:hypothetical protein
LSGKWTVLLSVLAVAITPLNLAILAGQAPAMAAAHSASAGKLFDDDDFNEGLTKITRKSIRD